jgi:hypothetical protein
MVVAAAAIGVAVDFTSQVIRHKDGMVSRPTLAQLAAKNYRVLTKDQSRTPDIALTRLDPSVRTT